MVVTINLNFFIRHRFALVSAFRSRYLLTLGSTCYTYDLDFLFSSGEAECA